MRTLRIREDGSYYDMWVDKTNLRFPRNQTEIHVTNTPMGTIVDIRSVPYLGQETVVTVCVDRIDSMYTISQTFIVEA